MSSDDLRDHEADDATSLHDSNGLPVCRCKNCGNYLTDEDLTLDAIRYAAANAGADDDGCARTSLVASFTRGITIDRFKRRSRPKLT
ncbi:hypothetical protein WHZ78_07275 [Bradyrhizobium symbiodeficiens]|uniref:hypothetical protein n=1 Tax=Bradyrhizobium symbiodeficiens TaxID=1404367 RepID=UPI0030CEBF70